MKVQRKHENYLEAYRRHAKGCPVTSRTEMGRCECPIWAYGRIDGRMVRLSCGTRSQDRAATVMDRLLHPAKPQALDADIAERANEGDDVSIERAANAFLASRRAKECAERSIALYDRTLATFGRFCEAHGVVYLKNVTAEHVIGYVQSRAAKWGSRTKIQQLTNLRIFFRWAMAMKWIAENPAAAERVPFPKRPRGYVRKPFTPEQIAKILTAVEQVPEIQRKQVRAFILLLMYSGMRISDATMLLRSSVNFETRLLTFTAIKTKHANTPIELHPDAIRALKNLPVLDGPHVFLNAREAGRGMLSGIRKTKKWVRRVLDLAGVKGSPHTFRDTFAISLLAGGVDIFTVSQLLGHRDVKITQSHYLNFIPGYLERMSQSTRKLDFRVA
jgi:integrase/recombinase XerC/integrase/recombinase XerD